MECPDFGRAAAVDTAEAVLAERFLGALAALAPASTESGAAGAEGYRCVAVWRPVASRLPPGERADGKASGGAPWGVLLSSRRELKVVEMQIAGCKVPGP